MSWVLLALRKSELKMTQSHYVARGLQITRAQRRAARGYHLEQMFVRNRMRTEKNTLYSSYKTNRDSLNAKIKALREQEADIRNASSNISSMKELSAKLKTKEEGTTEYDQIQNEILEYQTRIGNAQDACGLEPEKSTDEVNKVFSDSGYTSGKIKDIENQIADLQAELTKEKENYEVAANNVQNTGEDDLELLESDANDEDTMFEEEKVVNDTQLEAVKQELQTISEAISEYIQSEAIKL